MKIKNKNMLKNKKGELLASKLATILLIAAAIVVFITLIAFFFRPQIIAVRDAILNLF